MAAPAAPGWVGYLNVQPPRAPSQEEGKIKQTKGSNATAAPMKDEGRRMKAEDSQQTMFASSNPRTARSA